MLRRTLLGRFGATVSFLLFGGNGAKHRDPQQPFFGRTIERIPGRVDTCLGRGTVTVYKLSDGQLVEDEDAGGFSALNLFEASVAPNRFVMLHLCYDDVEERTEWVIRSADV